MIINSGSEEVRDEDEDYGELGEIALILGVVGDGGGELEEHGANLQGLEDVCCGDGNLRNSARTCWTSRVTQMETRDLGTRRGPRGSGQ